VMETDGTTHVMVDGQADQPAALIPLPAPSRIDGLSPALGYSTILVDRNDRLPTICGKLDAARLPDVAISVPRGNSALSTPVGMRLLMRHADRAGKSIVLVTRRQSVRQIARAEGQPYVGSERRVRFGRGARFQALLGGLDLPFPAASTIAWLIGLLVLIGGTVALIFAVLPDATLTLFPPATAISQEALFSLDTVANRVDPATAVVPAARHRVSVVRAVVLPVSGSAPREQTSGDPISVPAVDSDDITRAQKLAVPALTEQALQELRLRYGAGWEFFPQTADVQITAIEPAQTAGAAAAFLTVTYRGSVSMLGAREADLRGLLDSALSRQVQAGKQVIDSSVRLSVVKAGPFDKVADRLPVVMRLDASTAPALDVGRVRRALVGKSRREATAIAERATAAAHPPVLKLSPGWAPWLPRLGSRVKIELAAANP